MLDRYHTEMTHFLKASRVDYGILVLEHARLAMHVTIPDEPPNTYDLEEPVSLILFLQTGK